MASLHRYTVHEAANIKLGTMGCTLINNTNAQTGAWGIIRCITAATFSVLTDVDADGDILTGVEFPIGTFLYGNFIAITLDSGMVIAHKAPKGTA